MVKEECQHDLKNMFFRKKVKGQYTQNWTQIKGYKICNNCLKVFKINHKEVINGE